jgi:N-acyl-D-aspartate/D-glutamate deacylase
MLDLVVKGGKVVDGTGKVSFRADLGIQDGRIVTIGQLKHAEAAEELDAGNLVVAPGFVDIHSHSDFTLIADPRAQSSVGQGITTELIGNCGHGCAPLVHVEAAKGNIYGYDSRVPVGWQTMAGYLEQLEAVQPAVNVLTLVPNGMLRLAVMGGADRPANPEELRRMTQYLEAGLEAGAFGFSTGLEYPSERACTEENLAELCCVVAKYGGLYAPHLRNREVRALESIEETLQTVKMSGVRLHIPHLTPRRGGPTDADVQALRLIDEALDAGLDVSFDMHTRLYGLSNLSAALPPWAFEGGAEKLRERLRDTEIRAQFAHYESLITSFGLGGWEYVSVLTSAQHPEWVGKSFHELAEKRGTAPFDVVLNLLCDEADDPHFPLVLCESYTESQLRRAYEHPVGMVASDATALCIDGLLAESVFHGAFTWAAWFFRRFVREENMFTLEEGIRKVTSLPAQRLGLSDRGTLEVGAWADLAVFDAETFGERGTLREPNQLAQGMKHVVVNGRVEMKDGQFTGVRNGQVLRR